MPGRGKSGRKAEVIQLIETGPDGCDLSALVGQALGVQARPPGSKTAWELRTEYGVSRSVMQKTLKKLRDAGAIESLKIIERDEQGKAHQNTVYVMVAK
jgi:DNA-binding transcriptional regulator GbsR (MarR family)